MLSSPTVSSLTDQLNAMLAEPNVIHSVCFTRQVHFYNNVFDTVILRLNSGDRGSWILGNALSVNYTDPAPDHQLISL